MKWREGLIVSLDPGNYRGITLLSVVGKVFCKILNDRLVQYLDKSSEGQAAFVQVGVVITSLLSMN